MSRVSIDLLRHGDTGERSYRGQLDDALTDEGWAQLRRSVAGHEWDLVVSSSLQRCARFAHELADTRGLPLRLDTRLVEYHFGAWQGVPIETLAVDQGDALGRFWIDPVRNPPPGGEAFDAFRERLFAALDHIVESAAISSSAQRVLVITHGGAIRLLRCAAEQRSYSDMANIEVPHASLHALSWPLATGSS